jgi:hypothetical protein
MSLRADIETLWTAYDAGEVDAERSDAHDLETLDAFLDAL